VATAILCRSLTERWISSVGWSPDLTTRSIMPSALPCFHGCSLP
jgi:hypothetical protein